MKTTDHRAFSNIEPLESRIAPAVIIVNNPTDSAAPGKTDLRQALAMADVDLQAHHGVTNTIKFALPRRPATARPPSCSTGRLPPSASSISLVPRRHHWFRGGASAHRFP